MATAEQYAVDLVNTGQSAGFHPVGGFINDINGTNAANIFSALEADKARAFNSAESQINRDWETYMSNTAYQRQVEDMKAAGLNPAAINGNGASSPTGTPATSNSARSVSPGSSLMSLINSMASRAISTAVFRGMSNSATKAKDLADEVRKINHKAAVSAEAAAEAKRGYKGVFYGWNKENRRQNYDPSGDTPAHHAYITSKYKPW